MAIGLKTLSKSVDERQRRRTEYEESVVSLKEAVDTVFARQKNLYLPSPFDIDFCLCEQFRLVRLKSVIHLFAGFHYFVIYYISRELN